MGEVEKIKTVCRSCHGGCGVIAHRQDGRVIKVVGDPDSPISFGIMCTKGLAVTQLAYHPDRVLYPMIKTADKWNRVSWDEAMGTIVEKFNDVTEKYGSEAIIIGQGTGRDYESHFSRFGNLLNTPNVLTAGHMCYLSRTAVTLITCGNLPICDYQNNPKCIVLWGVNPLWSNQDEYKGVNLWRAYENGAKLIVIDPRKSFMSDKAEVWLQIRPGTDAAMALGWLRVIIEEELYDREFVDEHFHKWDTVVGRVMNDYPLGV